MSLDVSGFGIVIMAAGKGTRLKSKRPKVLHEIGGQALLRHVIVAAAAVVPVERIWCVVGHEAERVRAAVTATGVGFVEQPEQRGTGDALRQVKAYFLGSDGILPENLVVLSGDVPLIRAETILALCETHLKERAAMTILTALPETPFGYGRVVRVSPGAVEVSAIVEQKMLTLEQMNAPEINSGIYCFRTAALFEKLDLLTTGNVQGEYYLTDVAAMLVRDGERVIAEQADNVDEVLGANTIAEMMHLDAAMRLAKARRLMAAGVTIFRPETCVIDNGVEVGADTVIEPYVQLLGMTRVGVECRIRSYTVVQHCQIGDGVLLRNGCVLDSSQVGDGATLGPYAHLRPESCIRARAHVGNFVETKKMTLGVGSKANHLSYLGNATIGDGVNIGAGTITCNYDGVHKHETVIGDGVFVGSDSTLVAPVRLGEGAYIAAGSCITEEVPAGALGLGRARQVTKEGWAAARIAERIIRGNA